MKDYYYILGVDYNSTNIEIKKAYRKLSLKFHPDQNNSDKFFEDRFKDILEAYETLSNKSKRTLYDISYSSFFSKRKNKRKKLPPPEILRFESNVTDCTINDIVRIEWATKGAIEVSLTSFKDDLPANGYEIIKVSDVLLDGEVNLELVAVNADNESISSNIVIHINKDKSSSSSDPVKNMINFIKKNSYMTIALFALIVLLYSGRDKLYQYYNSESDANRGPANSIAEDQVDTNLYDPFTNVKKCDYTSNNLEISMQTIFTPSDNIAKHKVKITNQVNQKTSDFLSESDVSSTYRDWEEEMDFSCHNIGDNIIIDDYNYDGFQDIAIISHMSLGNRAFNFYLQNDDFNFKRDKYLSEMIQFPGYFNKSEKQFKIVSYRMMGTIEGTQTYEFNDRLERWEDIGYVERDY